MVIVIITSLYLFFSSRVLTTKEVQIEKVSLNNNKGDLIIEGEILSSAISFDSYTYRVDNSNLYIKIKGSLVRSNKKNGRFSISISDSDLNVVSQIFLEDKSETKIIYPKTSK